jgi:hypothetical protein
MIDVTSAIFKFYPQTVTTVGSDNPIAYDANGNEVTYDLEAVTQLAKNLEVVTNRHNAYVVEADPLFFKAQRGEGTMADWEAKVAEIKARYPKV